ncbi:MAG: thermonuclease family protein [Dongiaceae bacterium]
MIGRRHLWQAAIGAALLVAPAGGAARAEMLAGPVPARLVAVIDGDTIRVRARIWLDQEVETAVRLFGIDAPELTGACAAERALALDARDFVAAQVGAAELALSDIAHDKFGGRVVARVRTSTGLDLAAALLAAGLARPYAGGPRRSWCEQASVE